MHPALSGRSCGALTAPATPLDGMPAHVQSNQPARVVNEMHIVFSRYTQKGSYRRRATCLDATCVCADVLEFEPLYGDKPEKSDARTRSKGSYLGIVHAFVLPMHTLCSFLHLA